MTKRKPKHRPLTILRKMRKVVEKCEGRVMYLELCAAMPFPQFWECVLFLVDYQISGHRRATVLRRIDAAIASLVKP